MKKCWSAILSVTFVIVLSYALSGCTSARIAIGDRPPGSEGYHKTKGGPPPWAPAHGYRAKHQYRYYPEQSVYYDDRRGVYFYYRNGQWEVSANLPVGIEIEFGNYITLEMDTDKPYIYHNDVEAKYPPGKVKNKAKKREKKPKKW